MSKKTNSTPSEIQKILSQQESISNGGNKKYFGAAVGAGIFGLIAAVSLSAPDKEPAASKPAIEVSTTGATELTAEQVAQNIEDTLNSGQEFMGADVKVGQYFLVNPEFSEETGIYTIYHPVQLDDDSFGYINVNQVDGTVNITEIDASKGQLLDFEGADPAGYSRIGEYGLVVTEAPGGDGFVAALNDKAGTFVGQTSPYLGK